MSRQDYLPRSDNDLLAWYDQFATAVQATAPALGILPADVTAVAGKLTDLQDGLTAAASTKAAAQAAVATKNAARDAAKTYARGLAARLRAHPDYTPAYAATLGLVGPEETPGPAQPDLALEGPAAAGAVTVGFLKGTWSGVEIRSRRGGEGTFSFLARDTESPYVDTRQNLVAGSPETRQYVAQFLDGDELVGGPSDILSVTVPG